MTSGHESQCVILCNYCMHMRCALAELTGMVIISRHGRDREGDGDTPRFPPPYPILLSVSIEVDPCCCKQAFVILGTNTQHIML